MPHTVAMPDLSARRALAPRPWTSAVVEERVRTVSEAVAPLSVGAAYDLVEGLVVESHRIHDVECLNLNPATNVMNPRAEALLSRGLGSRASLGHPGEKYETGLEAIEQIEVVAAELSAEVFGASYAEVRVGSGALANLYAFMATCRPGETIVAPPPDIGGHVTHHAGGAAGLYGLRTLSAPGDPETYSVDLAALADLVRAERPRLVTVGGSLNLFPHPVAEIRAIADEVGAMVLFDAAHLCGMVAGGVWPNPLDQGAHLVTMSTYKSLGGPPGGLVVTRDAALAERLDSIAYPGLTANSDAGRIAALAMTMVDWSAVGHDYAAAMAANARRLAEELLALDVPVFTTGRGATTSHQLAVRAAEYGGGQTASRRLRRAHLLTCGIGLPDPPVTGDLNGLRIGTPELTRLGMGESDMATLASFVARGLRSETPERVGAEVTEWRSDFTRVGFTAG